MSGCHFEWDCPNQFDWRIRLCLCDVWCVPLSIGIDPTNQVKSSMVPRVPHPSTIIPLGWKKASNQAHFTSPVAHAFAGRYFHLQKQAFCQVKKSALSWVHAPVPYLGPLAQLANHPKFNALRQAVPRRGDRFSKSWSCSATRMSKVQQHPSTLNQVLTVIAKAGLEGGKLESWIILFGESFYQAIRARMAETSVQYSPLSECKIGLILIGRSATWKSRALPILSL